MRMPAVTYLYRTTDYRLCLKDIAVPHYQRVANGPNLKEIMRSDYKRRACILCTIRSV